MQSVTGTFQVPQTGSNFLAKFIVGEKSHTFEGTCGSSALVACSAVVVLTYAKDSDLTSAQTFSGDVGKTTINLKLNDPVTIVGTLDNPISTDSSVTGSGQWYQG